MHTHYTTGERGCSSIGGVIGSVVTSNVVDRGFIGGVMV